MKFFRIKNYEKYQVKKTDRNALPWIKLQKKMMNDWEYGELSVGERLMYVHMLLVADSVNNRFAMDTKWLHSKLQVKAPLKIEKFEKLGFIEILGSEKKVDRSVRREDINLEDINLEESESNPPPAPKRFKQVNRNPEKFDEGKPDTQSVIIHYESEYQRIFKNIPIYTQGKAHSVLLPILMRYGEEETKALITEYLGWSENEWVVREGWPVSGLTNAINALLAARTRAREPTPEEKQEELDRMLQEDIEKYERNQKVKA